MDTILNNMCSELLKDTPSLDVLRNLFYDYIPTIEDEYERNRVTNIFMGSEPSIHYHEYSVVSRLAMRLNVGCFEPPKVAYYIVQLGEADEYSLLLALKYKCVIEGLDDVQLITHLINVKPELIFEVRGHLIAEVLRRVEKSTKDKIKISCSQLLDEVHSLTLLPSRLIREAIIQSIRKVNQIYYILGEDQVDEVVDYDSDH
jgi:hypothetical protein